MLYELRASIIDSNTIMSQEDAFRYLCNQSQYTIYDNSIEDGEEKRKKFTSDILSNDLLPHCKTKIQKIYYLG